MLAARGGCAWLRASLDGHSNRTEKHIQKFVSIEIQPIHTEECWHEERSPELKQVHYEDLKIVLKAIDDSNPDGNRRHLIFIKPQTFMFTPEELQNYDVVLDVIWQEVAAESVDTPEPST